MPRVYSRICDWCGEAYTGRGERFCSRNCMSGSPGDPPHLREEDFLRPVNIHVTPKTYTAAKPKTDEVTSVHYGDIHFPHHDPRALTIRNKVLDFLSPEVVVDHGDTLDCEAISKYPKDPAHRVSLASEIAMASSDFGIVHSITPSARHLWFEGNHEDRLKRLLWKAADSRDLGEVLGLEGVSDHLRWGNLLGLDGLGWESTPYPGHVLLFDKMMLIHGNTVRTQSAYSARAEYDRYGKSGLSGHTHRLGSYYRRDYNGVHSWHELGMLGRIRNDYVAHANWQQGLGVITWSADHSRWGFEAVMIHEGVGYFRGLRFEG